MMVRAGSRITTTEQAAHDPTVLAFGWLQGAANRLEYILGRVIADEFVISHAMFEVLLILRRAGDPDGQPRRSPGPGHPGRASPGGRVPNPLMLT